MTGSAHTGDGGPAARAARAARAAADQIVVVDGGWIADAGTHEELASHSLVYHDMRSQQIPEIMI